MKALARTLGLVCFIATAAQASDIKLPTKISWAVLSESAGAEAAAIGAALRSEAGVELEIKFVHADLARDDMLRKGQVDFAANSVGSSIGAQEGVFGFADPDWGPQKVRLVFADADEPVDYGRSRRSRNHELRGPQGQTGGLVQRRDRG